MDWKSSVCVLVVSTCLAGNVGGGITNTSSSPNAKLRSVDIGSVQWTDGFWAERFDVCKKTMIPNIVRTIAEVAGYAYGLSDEGVWIHLYGGNVLDTHLPDGSPIKLNQQTDYPWEGSIRITVEKASQKEFSMFLRIPGWAENARVTINGQLHRAGLRPGQYFEIRRKWAEGDRIDLVFPMDVQLLEAHPLVEEARNQVAIRRGPMIYCLESADLPDDVGVMNITISADTQFQHRYSNNLLGGVTILETTASIRDRDDWGNTLYRRLSTKKSKTADIRLIPYYAWGNRDDGEMTVWIPLR